jgi:hypothetical protein
MPKNLDAAPAWRARLFDRTVGPLDGDRIVKRLFA